MPWVLWGAVAFVLCVAVYDRLQRKHSIISNFPILGRFRYWFESSAGRSGSTS